MLALHGDTMFYCWILLIAASRAHSGIAQLRNGRSEIVAIAKNSPLLLNTCTYNTRYSGDGARIEERGTRRSRRRRRRSAYATTGNDDGRHEGRVVLGSLRRAAANGADAIPPNSSSRSIEVHGRKQAPFYPVHSAATRKVDGRRGAPRARRRDGEGERVRAPLSRCLSPSHARHLSFSRPSRSLPYTPLRAPTRVANRCAVYYVYDHPTNDSPG